MVRPSVAPHDFGLGCLKLLAVRGPSYRDRQLTALRIRELGCPDLRDVLELLFTPNLRVADHG